VFASPPGRIQEKRGPPAGDTFLFLFSVHVGDFPGRCGERGNTWIRSFFFLGPPNDIFPRRGSPAFFPFSASLLEARILLKLCLSFSPRAGKVFLDRFAGAAASFFPFLIRGRSVSEFNALTGVMPGALPLPALDPRTGGREKGLQCSSLPPFLLLSFSRGTPLQISSWNWQIFFL